MKRRSETSPRDPLRLISSSVRGFNGVRTNRRFTANAVKNKKVKFTVRDADPHPHDEPAASSERHESARPRRSDIPKTSEYAFFKKLKKDARCSESSVVREEDEQKISEPSGSIRDFTTMLRDNFDKIRPSIHLEKARLNSNIFSSPPQGNVPKNLEAARVVENSHNNIRTPVLAKSVNFTDQNLLLSPPGDASQKSGLEELDGDMFSQKRMRLLQWVAETSVPEVEKLCSKGYDLVSALLNRLLSDGDQSEHCRDKEATQMSTDTKYSIDEFLHEDTYCEIFRRSRMRDFTEAETLLYLGDFCNKSREIVPFKLDLGPFSSHSTSQYLSDEFLLEETYTRKSHWTKSRDCIEADRVWDLDDDFSKSRKMIPLYLDTRITTSPSASHAHFQYGNNKQYFNFDDGTTSIFSSRRPYFCSDLEAYGSSLSSHIKEQNKFQALDESDCGRGSDTMLLGWNYANSQDKRDLSHNTCDKEMNLLSDPSMHNSSRVHEPHSILLDTDDCSDITLFPFTHLEKLNNWDSRFFEEDKLLVAKLEPYPLPLSYVPKCLDTSEDSDTYTSCNVNDGIQHNNWVINKVLSEQYHSELEPLLPFGHGLNTYRKCLPSSGLQSPPKERTCSYLLTDEQENFFYSSQNRQSRTPCAEDILEWPSLNLQKPSGTEIICPFPLNNSSSWLPSEEGNYDDDDLMF